jgi:hypothetical protein
MVRGIAPSAPGSQRIDRRRHDGYSGTNDSEMITSFKKKWPPFG